MTTPRQLITDSEYLERQERLRQALAERELDAAIVWGRGGGTADRNADVRYLTGFYPVFPTIRDLPQVWSDRGLAALLITPDEVLLFSDDPGAAEASTGVTDSVFRSGVSDRSLVRDVIGALRDRAELRSIALLSADAMSGHHARVLLSDDYAASLDLRWDDEIVEDLRLHKSERETELMRGAARVAEAALEAAFAEAAPGVPEADVVGAMLREIARHEAAFVNAFVYTTSVDGVAEDNRQPTHSARPLEAGDLFTVDVTGTLAGYYFDLARSWVVGAAPTPSQQRAYDVAKHSVDAVVEALRPGARVGDAARVGSKVLREAGVDPDAGEFPARGHGLGLAFERPWVREENQLVLEAGMVISIEQFVTLDGASATYERNILIGADGPEDLVAVRDFWAASAEQGAK